MRKGVEMNRKGEMQQVVKFALDHGFREAGGRNGHIVLAKDGRRVHLSGSPGCCHAAKNALKDIKRILEGNHG